MSAAAHEIGEQTAQQSGIHGLCLVTYDVGL
jgi:hypothetical protein